MAAAAKRVVELYVNSDKGVLMDPHRKNMPPFRQIYGKKSQTWEADRDVKGLSAPERELMEWLTGLCEAHGFELKVYDIEKVKHALRAKRKSVATIPTVIIGGQRFEGDMDKGQILKALAP